MSYVLLGDCTEFYSLEGSLSGELFQRGSRGVRIHKRHSFKKIMIVEHQKFTTKHTQTKKKKTQVNEFSTFYVHHAKSLDSFLWHAPYPEPIPCFAQPWIPLGLTRLLTAMADGLMVDSTHSPKWQATHSQQGPWLPCARNKKHHKLFSNKQNNSIHILKNCFIYVLEKAN